MAKRTTKPRAATAAPSDDTPLLADVTDAGVETYESEGPDDGMSIHQRLLGAIADVQAVGQRCEIRNREGKVMYRGVAHGDITAAAKAVMLRWGIVPIWSVAGHEQVGANMVRVEMTLHLHSAGQPLGRVRDAVDWRRRRRRRQPEQEGHHQRDQGRPCADVHDWRGRRFRRPLLRAMVEDVQQIPPGQIGPRLMGGIMRWAGVPVGASEDEKLAALDEYCRARGVDLRAAKADGDVTTMRSELRYVLEANAYGWTWADFLRNPGAKAFQTPTSTRPPGRTQRERIAAAVEEGKA
jgi:hypothetical protein